MADLLKDFNRPRHFITETIREITQVRGVPLHEIPIYETALCACATPLLSLSHSTDPAGVRADAAIHDKVQVLLRGLDKFLTACFKDIAYLTQKISYLDDGSHMLMTLSAITDMASSLVVLARLKLVVLVIASLELLVLEHAGLESVFVLEHTCLELVVLVLVVARDAVRALHRGERERRRAGDAGDDGLGVEGEDRRVHVDLVRVEDRRVWEGLEDGRWELVDVSERVFIWTV